MTIGDTYGTAYYTTDGSNPESSNTRIAYSTPFTVYQSETINAANYSSAGWSAMTSAAFSSERHRITRGAGHLPDGGTFTTEQTVTIGDTYGTAYYTTDGSNPDGKQHRPHLQRPIHRQPVRDDQCRQLQFLRLEHLRPQPRCI